MQRRTLLKTTIAAGVVLVAAGLGARAIATGLPWRDGRLDERGRAVFAALARGVLDGTLSNVDAVRQSEIAAHLDRVEQAIAQFPPHLQAEVAQLLALIAHPAGRRWFVGLAPDWPDATADDIGRALQGLRTSTWALRQQAYHALRDLTNAAYYSEPGTWAHLGYPGPIPV